MEDIAKAINEADSKVRKAQIWSYRAERGVRIWLEDKYPYPQFAIRSTNHHDYGIDFIVEPSSFLTSDKQFARITVIVKYSKQGVSFFGKYGALNKEIEDCKNIANDTNVLLVLVTGDEDTATLMVRRAQKYMDSIPENLSLVFGFLENGYLSVVSMHP